MTRRLELALFWIALALTLGACEFLDGRFFPTRLGTLGHDYAFFLPRLLAGDYWAAKNGVLDLIQFLLPTRRRCKYSSPVSPCGSFPSI